MPEGGGDSDFAICPSCGGALSAAPLRCAECAAVYPSEEGIPILLRADIAELVRRERVYWNERFRRDGSVEVMQAFFAGARTLRDEWGLRSYLAKLLAALPPRARVLEVACGVGSQAAPLALYHGCEAVLTDVAEVGLALNRDAAKLIDADVAIECYVADAGNLPFADATFDAVLIHAGLHHLVEPAQAFAEMSRCLRPGGVVALGYEPNRLVFHPIRRLADRLAITERHTRRFVPGDYSVADDETPGFHARELRAWVEECGLEVLWLEPIWFTTALTYHIPALSSLMLGRQLAVPERVRRAGLWIDEKILARVPGLRQLSLAWTMGARKVAADRCE